MTQLGVRAVREAAVPDSRERIHWDRGLPGFGLRVLRSGSASWIVQYRTPSGHTRRASLGSHKVLTPDEARKQARQLLAAAATGRDPSRERREARAAGTVSQFAELYLERHVRAKLRPSTIRSTERALQQLILPVFGPCKLAMVTRADVARWHARFAQGRPIWGNRVLLMLHHMYETALRWGYLPESAINPATRIERHREKARQRYLTSAEVARLGQALKELVAEGRIIPSAAACIRLILLTGMRRGEAMGLRWEWVDFERSVIMLPDSKTGAKMVPLGEAAIRFLKALPRDDATFAFPSWRHGQPLSNLNIPFEKLRRRAEVRDVRIHDLRHAFASFGVQRGLSLPIIGAMLGHRDIASTQRYAHLSIDPVKRAADQISVAISEHLGE